MVIHSSFPEFALFLYVHIAHVDNTYDPKELAAIKSKMAGLFPEGTDMEKKLYQAIREYNNFDRSRINQLCRDSFEYFNKQKIIKHDQIFEDAQAIIDADGKVLEVETDALRTIKRLIEHYV